jgi:hypothetical protein
MSPQTSQTARRKETALNRDKLPKILRRLEVIGFERDADGRYLNSNRTSAAMRRRVVGITAGTVPRTCWRPGLGSPARMPGGRARIDAKRRLAWVE